MRSPRLVFLMVFALAVFALRARAQSNPPSSSVPPAASAQADPSDQADADDDSQGDDSGDDDGPITHNLSLDVTFDARGGAKVSAIAAPLSDAVYSDFKPIVVQALACRSLEDGPKAPKLYILSANCTAPSGSGRFLHEGAISTATLAAYAQSHGFDNLMLTLHYPEADIIESNPPAKSPFDAFTGRLGTSRRNRAWLQRFERRQASYFWKLSDPVPKEIHYRFGYSQQALVRGLVYVVLALLLPLLGCYWLGRKALSAQTNDKAVVWFSYMRWLRWSLTIAMFAWWIALEESHGEQILKFLAEGTRYAPLLSNEIVRMVLFWFPPALVSYLCLLLSHPVQQRLRGLPWTARELRLQSLYSLLVGFVPVVFFFHALGLMAGQFQEAMIWLCAAAVVRGLAGKALLKITRMRPHALNTGDLRDRAFKMAEQLGVKLQQVLLIPSGKGQMANAFARTGNTIAFTDFLLQRMSRREVDYVLGHELTHLKLKHPQKIGGAYVGGYFLGILVFGLASPFLPQHGAFGYAIIFGFVTLVPYFLSRRFEYSADAGAVSATGDPRAAISALFKLAELNMMPTQWSHWSEKWLTHPSSVRRAQAIAAKAGIPFEEIAVIVREGAAETVTYSEKSVVAPPDKVYSSQVKKSVSTKLAWSLIATLSLVPALFGLLAAHAPSSPLRIAALIAGVPGTFLAFLLLQHFSPSISRGDIEKTLEKKLLADGIRAKEWSGVYVGYAPTAMTRSFEGAYNWDLGYLFFRSDRVCYCGEEARFSLTRDQIQEIKVAPGSPGFYPMNRIFVSWSDSERGTFGVFNLGVRSQATIAEANRAIAEIAQRLETWRQSPSAVRPLPPQLASLQSPALVNVTSSPLGAALKKKIGKELVFMAMFAAVGAGLLGLHFHLIQYLTFAASPRLRELLPVRPLTPGAGWYAVSVSVLIRWVTAIPILRYKEKPVLSATAPVVTRTAAPPPPFPTEPTPSPRDPVPVS